MRASYVLPLRSTQPLADPEFDAYLRRLAERVEVLVIDGSEAAVFAAHCDRWGGFVRHLPVDPDLVSPMGKVGGVLTGVRHARHERLIIADDDVRYDPDTLAAIVAALNGAEVVRPQNYFDPLPWHARWDTGRTLLNRACGGDWPGTLAVRRSALIATGGYDGRALFENLELVRTVVAAGGRERLAQDLLVRRIPSTTQHFLGQRVRQAYDEFARPARLAFQLAILPAVFTLAARKQWKTLAGAVVATALAAEVGRRRDGGTRVFPASSSLLAPFWLVVERGACSWLAVAMRLRHGGVRYRDGVLPLAANSMRELRRRHAGKLSSTSTLMGLNEPLLDNSAEQAVTPTNICISARSSR